MNLTRYNQTTQSPLKEILDDNFWGMSFFPLMDRTLTRGNQGLFPAIDVSEEKERIILKADLPGLKKEDIHVTLEDGILTVSGERKEEVEQNEKNYHRIERKFGQFVRSLDLGTKADNANVKASYKDGVLEIIVPKSERARAKSIDVQIG